MELLAKKGVIGECYNIGTTEEYTNMQMAYMLCDIFDVDPDKTITFIKDRPFNDQRYAVDWSKITALGWTSQHSLINEISDVAQWYYDNADRYVPSADLKTLNAPTKLGKPSLELSLAKVA